jgi:hypothetical protein
MTSFTLFGLLRKPLRQAAAVVVAAACASGGSRAAAEAEFAQLSRYLPADANAVVVVNAQELYNTPLGKRSNWRQHAADAFESNPILLPPSANQCVLAANIDVETLKPAWEAAAMSLSIDPSVGDIATRRGGATDTVGAFGAVWLGDRTCVVKFAPRVFGLLTPTSRQAATRWAASAASTESPTLSPYLAKAISYADSVGTQVILAVDLAGAINEARIRAGVAGSPILKGLPEDQAAAALASIQGVKLGVIVDEKLQGELRFDFGEDVALFAPVAKPLAIGILSRAGAMLDEFNDWEAAASGKTLSIKGELTPTGMQRLFSLLALDAGALERKDAATPTASVPPAASPGDPQPPAADDAMAKASQRYFRAVGKYVEDAQQLSRAKSLPQAVMWIENYARRVEAIPSRNVDPDLVKYGAYVAQTFRWAVDQAYGAEDKVNEQAAAEQGNVTYRLGYVPTGRTVNYGGNFQRMYAPYGFAEYHPDPQAAHKRQQTADDVYKTVEEARKALADLASDHEAVRKQLSERYGVKF